MPKERPLSPSERARQDPLALQAAPLALRLAGTAAMRNWGDIDCLRSAAMEGVRLAVMTFDESRGVPLRQWAKLKIKDQLRAERRRTLAKRSRGIASGADPASVESREGQPSSRMRREQFWENAVRGLTPPQAKAVIAVYRYGMTHAEAATELGVSSTAVQSRIDHAKATLQATLIGYSDLAV